MRVLVIGGTGRTGKLVVDEALERGHTVTTLARDPKALKPRTGLTIVKGTPLNQSDVFSAFDSTPNGPPNAIIVTLSSVRASDSPFAAVVSPPRLMTDCITNVIAAMKRYGVRKLVVMAALGVGDSFPSLTFPLRWLFRRSNMAASFEDHDAVDRIVKESGMDFVLVRPARLTDEDAKAVKEYGNQGKGIGLMSAISRKSVAVFLVASLEKSTWDRKTPVISN